MTDTTVRPDQQPAEQPHRLAWEILERIRYIDSTHPPVYRHPTNSALDIEWEPLSFAYGDLGACLSLAAADALRPDDGWDVVAHRHLVRAVERYRPLTALGPGIFTGVGGLAFCLRSLSRDGTRYGEAIRSVENEVFSRGRALIDRCTAGSGLAPSDYDVISGLAGMVGYIMSSTAQEQPRLFGLADSAIAALADTALETADIGGFWTPGAQVSEFEAGNLPGLWAGYLNLGFAHGIAGVVSVLGQALDRGMGGSRVRPAVTKLADLLLASATTAEPRDVPYHLSWHEHHSHGVAESARSNPGLSRFAWCYGNPGTALALSNSESTRREYADEIGPLFEPGARSVDQLDIDNPSLCHGYAGLMLIDKWIGEAIPSATDGTVGDFALQALLGLIDRSQPLLVRNAQQGHPQIDSPGFLDGSGGAAVALLAITGADEPVGLRALSGRWT
ncbi:lanthionine synthetase C family protein [Tsukamurella paurometabola]|uniref:Lanthionine synthetase C family protein n=1 Tax=Tsukamurella paurometabola TaxID=2061 RepID=A0A3P8L618_TSUPA|nr:lanthionine synthetase C family protein [Tsukamurella paurometabola]MBS4103835.1 lanthionine synthetase C family protein [Tsukamurella paurometabola]UEA81447.1 lanthionine synthetase C family protein [Tsukamurella paurometabola]VDR38441.1 Nisin biosynthesis protein nisC [Tsukamurella paurometabola]